MINYSAIQTEFNKVLAYSQGEANPKTDRLFEQWWEAKQSFIDHWGGKCIYEVEMPVTFSLENTEKIARAKHFIEIVEENYGFSDLSWFLSNNLDGFYENKTVAEYTTRTGTTIPVGAKLLKAFKHFVSDEFTLDRLQTEASMIIQEDKISGTLCFSVHPLDYLSSSENNYNWRSCHALDGEYRSGNLSYMCDTVTVVCYLKGAEEVTLPRFPKDVPWNNKKWRMLLVYDKNSRIMFAGRQYPFFSDSALDIVQAHFLRSIQTDSLYWSAWHDDTISQIAYRNGRDDHKTYKYFPIGEYLYRNFDLIEDVTTDERKEPLHFNDLLRSSYYQPYYAWDKYFFRGYDSHPKIMIGSRPSCIHCGNAGIEFSDSMYCQNCDEEFNGSSSDQFSFCDYCQGRVRTSEGIFLSNGDFVCDWCADNECVRCCNCDSLGYRENAKYYSKIDGFLCSNCWNDLIE